MTHTFPNGSLADLENGMGSYDSGIGKKREDVSRCSIVLQLEDAKSELNWQNAPKGGLGLVTS